MDYEPLRGENIKIIHPIDEELSWYYLHERITETMTFDADDIKGMFRCMAKATGENHDRLIALDSLAGDGDLGLSLDDGYNALLRVMDQTQEKDLGKLLFLFGKTFNTAAPSSAGTLFSAGMIHAAKQLRGQLQIEELGIELILRSIMAGVMEMGGAKPGEKTIVDGFMPAVEVLNDPCEGDCFQSKMRKAADAAIAGGESTADMLAIHGRAAIRGKDSIGMVDGGAVAAALMVKGIADYVSRAK